MGEDSKFSVLFVCLGNICRSPMAEAVFKHTVQKHGLLNRFAIIDSAGTASYHVGSTPDSRSVRTCAKHGIHTNHRARQLTEDDLRTFDYLLAMDTSNLEDIEEIAESMDKSKDTRLGNVQLFGHYREPNSKIDKIVRDPGTSGFEDNFRQLTLFSEEFLKQVLGVKL